MKKIFKAFSMVAIAVAAVMVNSCTDLDPKAQLADNLVWNSPTNFELFANQFYGYLHDFSSAISDGPHSDYRADLIATSQLNTYSQGTNTIPATDGNYGGCYKRIYYTNLLLKHAHEYGDTTAIATPMGEAYFFRAYEYFELVQMYGDVILITRPLDLDSEELQAARNDRGDVIDLCIADLQLAAKLLPDQPAEEGRLGKDAAYAMLSRVALYEGTWQKFHNNSTSRSQQLLAIAKDAAQQVMNRKHYKLFYNSTLGNQSYRYMFTLEAATAQTNPASATIADNTEYILAKRHRDGDRLGINITHAMLGNVCWVTRKMANMYLCSDGLPVTKSTKFQGYNSAVSEFQNRDNRMTNNMLYHGEKYWNNDGKWRTTWDDNDLNSCLTADARANSGYQNRKYAVERNVADYYESEQFPVIRYAEVLLNYAEAAYELNDGITDDDLNKSLNLVRTRVNKSMPKLTNAFVSSNGLNMREEIRRERTVELFLEGFRLDDLKRWNTAIDEMNEDQLGVKVTGTWFEANWSKQARSLNSDGCIILYTGRSWTEKNYLLPLPSDQLQLNKNLKQNPGWE